MNKVFQLLGIIYICSSVSAQEKLIEFKNDLDNSKYSIKEVIPVVNNKTNDLSLFFMNSKQVFGYLINDKFEVIKKLRSDDRRRKYNKIIGYSVKDSLNYNLYLANNKNNKFAEISFSFSGESSALKEFKLQNSIERFVQTTTINNVFYLISVESFSSTLKLYKFDGISAPKPHSIIFDKEAFLGRADSTEVLYNLFKVKSNGSYIDVETNKVESGTPNSIEVVSEEKKLYVRDDKLIFTFDKNRSITQILTINLKDYSYDIKRVKKPLFDIESRLKKSNSFINDSKLFTITSTNEKMEVNIQDYNSGKSIKDIKLSVNDSITFKNTPIIQEGGVYDNYRELESTKKFLRKITAGDLGINVYKKHMKYLITIGSEKEIRRGGGGMMMGGFGGFPMATIGSANMFFNPTFFAYNSYSSTKSVHIKSIFDLEFNHIDGEVKNNFFDKIRTHAQPGNLLAAKTIFKYKDYFILGNYISKSKTYILKRFND